ncbi:hypothetical protein SAMN05421743_103269 [Thalassobacillus cyri]|uniref:Biotin-requiring enzyme n=1 Tax=Thalassobacillus cyri TaxID=571932 RepID=A0A1H3ZKH2_9BACI|nr:hypothetical protein [Thalassobacillus cyri]SEA23921.1 hypothetical protein SAMN05421743_103269 [Thalassobacillus cyri]
MHGYELVVSPCEGVVEEISIGERSRVYEWESLFKIRTENGELENVAIGVSGLVHSLEVSEGEEVIAGMVMAQLQEDVVISGSD